ncbi:hypothetical protein [Cohnella sp. REN36]|uniref:hypothetical protein n=1 Tax=Cohnella sp. REN36 TaxID=2887347 RepID=UPI001D1443D1|nr:hypothetical protein [Cohnella sp. REN36]MCC3371530.1 hypothetical protein [Cohnella sp. REN36]
MISIHPAKANWQADRVRPWIGAPVCVVLKDGSYYVGYISEVGRGHFTLHGEKSPRKWRGSRSRPSGSVRTSGLLGLASSLFGGGLGGGLGGLLGGGAGLPGAAGALGAGGIGATGGGMFGMLGKAWPGIKLGFGMLRTIMPLLGGLKL